MIHNDNIIIGDVNNKDIVKIDNLKAEGNVPCEEQHEKMKKRIKRNIDRPYNRKAN